MELDDDPKYVDYPCLRTEANWWEENIALVGHTRYKKKDSDEWQYDYEETNGVGVDEDENAYFCVSE